jgi:hypothetical protein
VLIPANVAGPVVQSLITGLHEYRRAAVVKLAGSAAENRFCLYTRDQRAELWSGPVWGTDLLNAMHHLDAAGGCARVALAVNAPPSLAPFSPLIFFCSILSSSAFTWSRSMSKMLWLPHSRCSRCPSADTGSLADGHRRKNRPFVRR